MLLMQEEDETPVHAHARHTRMESDDDADVDDFISPPLDIASSDSALDPPTSDSRDTQQQIQHAIDYLTILMQTIAEGYRLQHVYECKAYVERQ